MARSDRVNEIANLAFLTAEANLKVSAQLPTAYLPGRRGGDPTPGTLSARRIRFARSVDLTVMKGTRLRLQRDWLVGDQIGDGGFGRVYAVQASGVEGAAKFIPKAPGADRELLFVELAGVRNVVPILESGEHTDYWVLVMPRAGESLREHIMKKGSAISVEETLTILRDVSTALADLEGRVVHRDVKPENVLRIGDSWCLADFGISRYAEASTAEDTRKFALSPPYAGPERWRAEHATSAADVYAVGVMAYEMVSGELPFAGPGWEDFREQHLHVRPPHLDATPVAFASLVDECLYKAVQARPTAANILARMERLAEPLASHGLLRLQEANKVEVERRAEVARRQSRQQTEAERRADLAASAQQGFGEFCSLVRKAIVDAAPAAIVTPRQDGGWLIRLNDAEMLVTGPTNHPAGIWGVPERVAFDAICAAAMAIKIPPDRWGYAGRSHSLWFGDIQTEGRFGWYETAFMYSALMQRSSPTNPFGLAPGPEAAKALGGGLNEFQVAWPFTAVVADDLGELIDRWAEWLAAGASGNLHQPGSMPERSPAGSWRRS